LARGVSVEIDDIENGELDCAMIGGDPDSPTTLGRLRYPAAGFELGTTYRFAAALPPKGGRLRLEILAGTAEEEEEEGISEDGPPPLLA
jgi:hypothetical protein